MIIEKLQKFGLSDKEAKVYSALFELGDSIVTKISKKAGLNRSTTYVLLESLVGRGLVSISEHRGVRFFSALPSSRLIEIAEADLKKSEDLLALSQELATSLKEIPAVSATGTKIKIYEGVGGFKILSEDRLSAKDGVRTYTSPEHMMRSFPKYFPEYTEKLGSRKNPVQVILPDTTETRAWLKENALSKAEKSLVTPNNYAGDLNIYDNKVTFTSPSENTSFSIESSQFAKAIKTLFDLATTKARRYNVHQEEKPIPSQEKDRVLVKAQKRFFAGK